MAETLDVRLNFRHVGTLRRESSGAVEFRYDAAWLAAPDGFGISLSLPRIERAYRGDPVLAVFEGLLPDSIDIRRHLAERVGAPGIDAFSLLGSIGRDCVGALQFVPPGTAIDAPATIAAEPASEAVIAHKLRNLGRAPLGLDRDEDFRISLAGAHEKTALLQRDGRWFVPHGPTPTTHILKRQIGMLPNGIDLSDSVENEFLCLAWLLAMGASAARAVIDTFEDQRVLTVERFDRMWHADGTAIDRLPQEDLCQACGVSPFRKYESEGGPGFREIFSLLLGADEPAQDRRLFLRANLLFWLLAATDGHAKNFSLHLHARGFHMTPLYDVVSAQPALDAAQLPHNSAKFALWVGKHRHYRLDEITARHWIETARMGAIGEREARAILQEVAETAGPAFDQVLEALPPQIPEALAASIGGGLRRRARELASALQAI
jgi:serine/threonine-protein kinase HipA